MNKEFKSTLAFYAAEDKSEKTPEIALYFIQDPTVEGPKFTGNMGSVLVTGHYASKDKGPYLSLSEKDTGKEVATAFYKIMKSKYVRSKLHVFIGESKYPVLADIERGVLSPEVKRNFCRHETWKDQLHDALTMGPAVAMGMLG